MTDAKFKQLVNSFLDREISQKDHLLLSREVASSPQRRTEFERYRKLHAAERQALAQLFAANGGVDPLGDPSDEAGHDIEISEERRQKAEQLKARAARAWSEVQLLTVERKKRRLLIWQFALAGLALLFAALALYRQSVGAIPGSGNYRKESEALNPESTHLAHLREQLLARQGISVGWISNERGEPVALVGRNDEGGVFVMTSSGLPGLSHLQLSALLNQLPPPATASATQTAVLPASMFGIPQISQQSPMLRNSFVASTRSGNVSLPNVDDLLEASSFVSPHQQQQSAYSRQLQPSQQFTHSRQLQSSQQSQQQPPPSRQLQSSQQLQQQSPLSRQLQALQQLQQQFLHSHQLQSLQQLQQQSPSPRQPQPSQQLQVERRQQAAPTESFISSPLPERSVELEVFWNSTHYHTEIHTTPPPPRTRIN